MTGPTGPVRLHGGGNFRRRLARALGRDESAGDAVWRRLTHMTGSLILVYYLIPNDLFVVAPKEVFLLLALAAAFVLEGLRFAVAVELPAIRSYEARRPASYLFYSVALALAVLVFPMPIAAAVVLGTAFVDPLAGELRSLRASEVARTGGPIAAYVALASTALALVGRWPILAAVGLGVLAAVVGVGVERWRFRWLDDDLTMTVAPAVALWAAAIVLGLPR